MPPVTRIGDKSTGHDSCPPVEAVEGASNFLVNGKPIVLVGDSYAPHGCIVHPSHQGKLAQGSPSFLVNGKQVGRIGDSISCGGTVAEGASFFSIGNGNEIKRNKFICEHNEIITRYTRREEDNIFFCLPLIAESFGNKELFEKDKKGWYYLRDMFYKWLAGSANDKVEENSDPFWVDIDWVLEFFATNVIWDYFIPNHVVNTQAINSLNSVLIQHGYIVKQDKEFDFINSPWQMWKPYYYQYYKIVGAVGGILSGLYAALGNFTIRFLPKGRIEYKENNQYIITIEQVAGFVYDIFNFEGEQSFGYWNCEKKSISINASKYDDNYKEISNEKFRDFREKNKIGNDFLVLSEPKIIDNFTQFKYNFIYDN